jgi:Xaa-Pro aminopeptidase
MSADTTRLSVFEDRLAALQQWVSEQGLDWLWVPASDAHLNEYLPERAKRRDWVCGFTGSAGDVLVGPQAVWLFADSRYHEQADHQVPLSMVQVAKVGLPGVVGVGKWLETAAMARTAESPLKLGVDPWTLPASAIIALQDALATSGKNGAHRLAMVSLSTNPIDALRATEDSPQAFLTEALPAIFGLPLDVTGQSSADKLTHLRQSMQAKGLTLTPVTRLDEVAWLTNARGQDIAYNPVFHAYALVSLTEAWLFVDVARLADGLAKTLIEQGWHLRPYEQWTEQLPHLVAGHSVAWAAGHHTYGLYETLLASADPTLPNPATLCKTSNAVQAAKSVKNETELAGMVHANLRSSRAICRLLAQLEQWAQDDEHDDEPVNEAQVAATLEDFYAEEPGFFGLSFNTISGSGANSSIVHYGTPDPNRIIDQGDWLLVDSGIQLLTDTAGGTTDCTRTTVWGGHPTARQKQVYTLVLKGHIAAAMAVVPPETTGQALDALCRGPLWQAGLDYGHGTGHGVGAFLNVHEGPNGIHKRATEPLKVGQVCSIEPGYYEAGWGGVRLENLAEVVPAPSTFSPWPGAAVQSGWLTTRPITWVPFDSALIDDSLLSESETEWLSEYHRIAQQKLAPLLADDPQTLAWLRSQTQRWL